MNDSSKAVAAVITRTKDRSLFLERAIRSVLGQTYPHWEHVIVNDGGDAAEVDLLVNSFAENYAGRVRVIHHKNSLGMQNASNAGIAASGGTYCAIHDDDDTWAPDFLETAIGFLEKEGASSSVQGVVTQTTQILEEIMVTGEFREDRRLAYHPFAYVTLGELRRRNLFPPIAFLYRRSAHDKVGMFRQEFDVLGDHDFNLRFLRHFEIGVVPTFHAYYHWRQASQGNTVTVGREIHRNMLARMKNVYHREFFDDPANAVGNIDEIPSPPPFVPDMGVFKKREGEVADPLPMPDFRQKYRFSVLSLDVFDTALKRRCHHPRDIFRFLAARAIAEGFPVKPYALARTRAEAISRDRLNREVTLEDIYTELARLLGLSSHESERLRELELTLEDEYLYADPRWIETYNSYRTAGIRVVFVSDMYLSGEEISALLKSKGFEDPQVFSSADLKLTKHDGQLLPEVARQLGVEPSEVLHVGDNFHSDFRRAVQCGLQAHHWSPDYGYQPWYTQVDPDYFDPSDTLSPRMMGQVRLRGEEKPWLPDRLLEKLGYEAAGPLYLSYMLWVVEEARKDGFCHLILLGRDGYYWEKTLKILAESNDLQVTFTYLHASRKVINFASFDGINEDALDFLTTPNPSLTVRDFIDRTGLHADDCLDAIHMAGFTNPLEVLTNETGGQFTESGHSPKLRELFLMLEGDLKALFQRDRNGLRQLLNEASFHPENSAFVDIGWLASAVKRMPHIVEPSKGKNLTGYYFGTWKEADPGNQGISLKSYFMHLGLPARHEALVRESVNWIESLHTAPFPTLEALTVEGGQVKPKFAARNRGGFSPEEQASIWSGAEQFLRDFTNKGLEPSGERGGFAYIYLVLKRLICEPSPAELAAWGKLEHSEGFGIEVSKPLIQHVADDASPEAIMAAYRASSWNRGFLASLSDQHRQFVFDRLEATKPKSYEQLVADFNHKIEQNDALWAENARLQYEMSLLTSQHQQQVEALRHSIDKLEGDLAWKTKPLDELRRPFRRRWASLKALFSGKAPR